MRISFALMPAPPLSDDSKVASLSVCRPSEPLLIESCAASTTKPRAVALSVPSTLSATTRLPLPPLVSVRTMPERDLLTLAVTLAAESLIRSTRSSSVSADAKSTVAVPPLRSVMSMLPSVPRPCPPLKLATKVSRKPEVKLSPVITPPTAVVVRPRSSAAEPVSPLMTVKLPAPAVRSVSSRRLPSAEMAADTLLDRSSSLLIVSTTSPSVEASVRSRLRSGVSSAKVKNRSSTPSFRRTPLPSFRLVSFVLLWIPNTSLPAPVASVVLMPASPRPAAVVPPETSWTDSVLAPPTLSVNTKVSPSDRGGYVERGFVVDRIEHVVDGTCQAKVDDCRVAGEVGDFDFAPFDTAAVVERVERNAFVDKSAEAKGQRTGALDIVKRFESLTDELLRAGCLCGAERKTAERWLAFGGQGRREYVFFGRRNTACLKRRRNFQLTQVELEAEDTARQRVDSNLLLLQTSGPRRQQVARLPSDTDQLIDRIVDRDPSDKTDVRLYSAHRKAVRCWSLAVSYGWLCPPREFPPRQV